MIVCQGIELTYRYKYDHQRLAGNQVHRCKRKSRRYWHNRLSSLHCHCLLSTHQYLQTRQRTQTSIERQLIASPVHMVIGSPWNPSRQTQSKDPGVLMQLLLPPQRFSSRHSSSSKQHTNLLLDSLHTNNKTIHEINVCLKWKEYIPGHVTATSWECVQVWIPRDPGQSTRTSSCPVQPRLVKKIGPLPAV